MTGGLILRVIYTTSPVDNSSGSEGDAGSDEDDPTTCFMDLERTMRINGFKPARVYVDKFDIREHDGKHMAIKYGTRSTAPVTYSTSYS